MLRERTNEPEKQFQGPCFYLKIEDLDKQTNSQAKASLPKSCKKVESYTNKSHHHPTRENTHTNVDNEEIVATQHKRVKWSY